MNPSNQQLAMAPFPRFLKRTILSSSGAPDAVGGPARFRRIACEQLDSIWRTACRLGGSPGDLDDIAQEVLSVVFQRLENIVPEKERAFVVGVTAKVTGNFRRSRRRRMEQSAEDDLVDLQR
jgi:DNA-directed RNA polymerase specialized sigma24 family protein